MKNQFLRIHQNNPILFFSFICVFLVSVFNTSYANSQEIKDPKLLDKILKETRNTCKAIVTKKEEEFYEKAKELEQCKLTNRETILIVKNEGKIADDTLKKIEIDLNKEKDIYTELSARRSELFDAYRKLRAKIGGNSSSTSLSISSPVNEIEEDYPIKYDMEDEINRSILFEEKVNYLVIECDAKIDKRAERVEKELEKKMIQCLLIKKAIYEDLTAVKVSLNIDIPKSKKTLSTTRNNNKILDQKNGELKAEIYGIKNLIFAKRNSKRARERMARQTMNIKAIVNAKTPMYEEKACNALINRDFPILLSLGEDCTRIPSHKKVGMKKQIKELREKDIRGMQSYCEKPKNWWVNNLCSGFWLIEELATACLTCLPEPKSQIELHHITNHGNERLRYLWF